MGLIIMPFANPANITGGITGVWDYNNSITNGVFVPAIVFTVWVVLFITMKGYGWRTSDSMSSSGFIVMMISILLRGAGLVQDWLVIVAIFGFLASVFFIIMDKDK